MRYKILLVALCAFIFAGCAGDKSSALYYWDGSYTSANYKYLSDEYDLNEQISMLRDSEQRAYEKGLKVPPGFYAHLGLLYSNLGNMPQAKAYFQKEVELFPESKSYIEFLLTQDKTTKAKK
ncbi:DUF4810 domain-containing protein [Campylobacter sp. RM9344]|uniref:DUF4810 domain-containing protein n=1 Tax=Campylobacter californiensis TaxID=1032243 RepID=A0AAW3ZWF3_9BACT|nr:MULTISPECIES: DUF4810 domain-containing protein [unclassified Campylobacter]MBE2985361.1 DUF4810 domain-containing protein [Campylobacter sp. RM6883]MBE2987194.1 DUF4810 domain-containing protein [Campylobacter sp. RM12919]MBE2988895.1 DUF4810 domain-containing protein [Campylobacter sp. RM12920]MBE2995173.1 DUF4810 domain-containing protein [Campylobacter sp. RM6913]MBE3021712.1 DUF4810 domain-containing protein [Campylobacter sp. 7477a]MBE3029094.1 DUF4810 domain-containing protein [Camp